eukprot:CAMPEP_0197441824 /NCGR_PEP_ID=MMETSP1175-20131217/7983_1 /TAXON_ID=1003142 /ORGANISM="Triceratium dubium, Strain CCMP147" /LENGTH=321 /DNA_ID=CAMNT_0042972159 /DNA_START=61 /DNA_END=1026 /DNA_ORIENTATION=+
MSIASSQSIATSPPRVAARSQPENPMVKLFIGSGCTWVYELSMGHYFEFVKIAKQTKPEMSYAALTREMTAQKGLIGVLDGFFPWGTVQALSKGAVFAFAHAGAKKALHPYSKEQGGPVPHMVVETMAGGIGGGLQGLVLSPILLLKTRVMTNPVFRQQMSLGQTVSMSTKVGMDVIRSEGISALMKGSIVFASKRVADWGTRFLFSTIVEDVLFKRGDETYKLSYNEKIAASLLGGTLSACSTIPIDVMVAQIQQAGKAGEKVSVLETFSAEFKAGGWERVAGFATRGFIARTAHVATTTALMKTMTSWVYDMYMGKGSH